MSLKDLSLKIESLGNVRKITQSMNMIATTKLSKPVNFVEKSKKYEAILLSIRDALLSSSQELSHPLLSEQPEADKIALIVISSDMGLCGGFNSSILKKAKSFIVDQGDEKIDLFGIGKKMRPLFNLKEEGYFITKKESFENVFRQFEKIPDFARELMSRLQKDFLKGQYKSIYVVYSQYVSILTHIPKVKRIFPVSLEVENKKPSFSGSQSEDFIIEDSNSELLGHFLTEYIEFYFLNLMMNSYAGENASRMMAMDSAVNNATEMIDETVLKRNRARQAKITTEITEIVSGAQSV